jgi:hypothetical protein
MDFEKETLTSVEMNPEHLALAKSASLETRLVGLHIREITSSKCTVQKSRRGEIYSGEIAPDEFTAFIFAQHPLLGKVFFGIGFGEEVLHEKN